MVDFRKTGHIITVCGPIFFNFYSVNLPIIATPKSSHIIANTELLKIGGCGGTLSKLKRKERNTCFVLVVELCS